MADTKGLRRIGLILGTVGVSVMLIAAALVHAHIDGRLAADGVDRQVTASSHVR